MRQGREIDLHHLELAFEGQSGKGAAGAESGVIDQHIHPGALALEMSENAGGRRRFRKVGGQDLGMRLAGAPQLFRQRLERLAFAGQQDHPAAFRRKTFSQLEADARRSPGDQNCLNAHNPIEPVPKARRTEAFVGSLRRKPLSGPLSNRLLLATKVATKASDKGCDKGPEQERNQWSVSRSRIFPT